LQLLAYTEHFSCIAVDLPGSGESDKPLGPYSTDGHADQVAAFLSAIGIDKAHVAGKVWPDRVGEARRQVARSCRGKPGADGVGLPHGNVRIRPRNIWKMNSRSTNAGRSSEATENVSTAVHASETT
jgi:hypothetical protein